MRYSERSKRVLRAVQFRADAGDGTIARELRLRPHIVRHELHRALMDGVARPATVIDFFRLGLQQYLCYFSAAMRGPEARTQILASMERSQRLAWYAEMGGRYHFGLSICTRNSRELNEFLDAFVQISGTRVLQRTIAVVTTFVYYPKKYLAPDITRKEEQLFDAGDAVAERDSIDDRILTLLVQHPGLAVSQLGQKLGIPRTTVALRIKKLRESQLLRPNGYLISGRMLGMQTFKVLIFLTHDNEALWRKVSAFALGHPAVVNLIRVHAPWEYELTVEIERAEQMPVLMQEVSQLLGDRLRDLEALPVFTQSRPPLFLKPYLAAQKV